MLARTITLVESTRPAHRKKAQDVLNALLPHTGKAYRIGLSGVPGVGKSTFLEAFGMRLIEQGHRVAVLAVDPSSSVSGGSILGDKTRMVRLASHPSAFVRPSPTKGTLGGVHQRTRETMLVCEAFGFDTILVETVGVGQSEITVSEMVDVFLVLLLSGAGDELQGIKKGILEVADILAVNKADGDNAPKAARAARDIKNALHFVRSVNPWWSPPVLTCSGLTGEGLAEVEQALERYRSDATREGAFSKRRDAQRLRWMWALIEQGLVARLRADPEIEIRLQKMKEDVLSGLRTPTSAAMKILDTFYDDK